MLQKEYNYKIYSLAGVFQRVIPATKVMSNISFSDTINAGQGELRLKLDLSMTSADIGYNQIIKVYESDSRTPTARCIYSGIIGSLQRVSEQAGDYLELRAVGVASMLSWFYYQTGASYTPNSTQAPDLTMKDIIDYFGTIYPGVLSYTGTSVEAGGTTSNINFNYTKCLDALKQVAETANVFWWNIDGNGVLQFHPKVGSAYAVTHKLTMGKHVEKVVVEEKTEKVVNKYILFYTGGDTSATDATSITANGLRELKETKTEINDGTTANTAAATYIANNKDYKRKIQVTVNDQYDIETIHPGNFITIRNLDYTITALQIQKVQYNIDKVELELEEVTSFAKEVFT